MTTERKYYGVPRVRQVWWVEGSRAARAMPEPLPSQLSQFDIRPGSSFERGIFELFSDDDGITAWDVVPMQLPPGHYYPRMARPTDMMPGNSPGFYPGIGDIQHELADMQRHLAALVRQLEQVCRYIHPAPETLNTYGAEIRELLILACTEVEENWRAVLRANGVSQERLTTRDYVALQDAMRLGDYAIRFDHFPALASFRPFAGWGASDAPTKELPWYDAYNAVKHSRSENFAKGTLEHAFSAVSACAAMVFAQVGRSQAFLRGSGLEGFLSIEAAPNWNYGEVYTWVYRDHDEMMMAVNVPPSNPTSLVAVAYPFNIPS